MSAQTNETLIRSLYTAFNTRKFDDALKLASPKLAWRDVATGEVVNGLEGMRQNMERWAGAFKDAKADVQRIIATDNVVVTEFIGRGTHTGPLETPGGTVDPTNKRVDIPFCDVTTIESGKVVAVSSYYDIATMLHQLGVAELAVAGAHK